MALAMALAMALELAKAVGQPVMNGQDQTWGAAGGDRPQCRLSLGLRLRSLRPIALRSRLWPSMAVAIGGLFLSANAGWAAESVEFIYGKIRAQVRVASLAALVEENRIERDLRLYARLLEPDEIAEIRSILGESANINNQVVFSFLNSPQGNTILLYLAQIVRNANGQPNVASLRAALSGATQDERGLSLLSVLQHYPAPNLEIDLGRAVGVVQRIEQVMALRQQALAAVASQFRQERSRRVLEFPREGEGAAALDLTQQGPYPWVMRSARASNGDRPLMPVDIYWPTRSGPPTKGDHLSHPIVVISHGLASNRKAFIYLAQHLASHGFVVAVPEHKGSDTDYVQALLDGRGSEIADPQDFMNRGKDVSSTLNLLEIIGPRLPGLPGTLDLDNAGIIGHSFGGYTALAVAGAKLDFDHIQNQCTNDILIPRPNPSLLLQCQAMFVKPFPKQRFVSLRDPRVKAAIAVNPVSSYLFGTEGLRSLRIPIAVIASSDDTIAPPLPEQFHPFTQLSSISKRLFVMIGANHFSVLWDETSDVFNLPGLTNRGNPTQYRAYFKTLSAAFMQRHLLGERKGDRYLDPRQNGQLLNDPVHPLYSLSRLRPEQLPALRPTLDGDSPPAGFPSLTNFTIFQELNRQGRNTRPFFER